MSQPSTPDAILDAAERLFARHGFDGTSIREITRAANANVAAVHYHFGSKEAVLRGVTGRIVGPMNARRIELLESAIAAAAPDPAGIDAVMEAFVRPDIETLQALQRRGPTVAHFLGRTYSDHTPWIQEMARQQFAPIAERFLPSVSAALPEVGLDRVTLRLERIGAMLAHIFATWPVVGLSDTEAEAMTTELITFCSAALAAPKLAE